MKPIATPTKRAGQGYYYPTGIEQHALVVNCPKCSAPMRPVPYDIVKNASMENMRCEHCQIDYALQYSQLVNLSQAPEVSDQKVDEVVDETKQTEVTATASDEVKTQETTEVTLETNTETKSGDGVTEHQ